MSEVIEAMTRVEAERITARIADKLDTIADHLEQVMPLIGEALTREAWRALGYQTPQAYVEERFKGALTRLPREVRRPVVAELSAAGMSTRAIAPIVGVSNGQAAKDLSATRHVLPEEAPVSDETPEPRPEPAQPEPSPVTPLPKSDHIVGRDGKAYARPEPKPSELRRKPLTDSFWEAAYDLGRITEKLTRLAQDDRFQTNREELARKNLRELTQVQSHLNDLIARLERN